MPYFDLLLLIFSEKGGTNKLSQARRDWPMSRDGIGMGKSFGKPAPYKQEQEVVVGYAFMLMQVGEILFY